jgi:hypothetical protein
MQISGHSDGLSGLLKIKLCERVREREHERERDVQKSSRPVCTCMQTNLTSLHTYVSVT